jgi:hypothetical protein
LFTQTTLLFIGTWASFGVKLGLPCTFAPARIVTDVVPGTAGGGGEEAALPVAAPLEGAVPTADTGGGFFAKLCQFGTAIAAPMAITPTRIIIPCNILLPLVL